MKKSDSSFKFVAIWFLITFLATVIALMFVGRFIPVGILGQVIKAAVFVIIGLASYTPIKNVVE